MIICIIIYNFRENMTSYYEEIINISDEKATYYLDMWQPKL